MSAVFSVAMLIIALVTEATAGCTGVRCAEQCNGAGCAAGCNGDYCGAYCNGAGCAQNCRGVNCAINCNGAGCDSGSTPNTPTPDPTAAPSQAPAPTPPPPGIPGFRIIGVGWCDGLPDDDAHNAGYKNNSQCAQECLDTASCLAFNNAFPDWHCVLYHGVPTHATPTGPHVSTCYGKGAAPTTSPSPAPTTPSPTSRPSTSAPSPPSPTAPAPTVVGYTTRPALTYPVRSAGSHSSGTCPSYVGSTIGCKMWCGTGNVQMYISSSMTGSVNSAGSTCTCLNNNQCTSGSGGGDGNVNIGGNTGHQGRSSSVSASVTLRPGYIAAIVAGIILVVAGGATFQHYKKKKSRNMEAGKSTYTNLAMDPMMEADSNSPHSESYAVYE